MKLISILQFAFSSTRGIVLFLLTLLVALTLSYLETHAQNVGIGTAAPQGKLHVDIGSDDSNLFLVEGDYDFTGSIPALGSGARMFFWPGKAAFRGGNVTSLNSTYWDASNIGRYSFAYGRDVRATNTDSYAMGDRLTSSGLNSFVLGFDATSSGDFSFALGADLWVEGDYSYALGNSLWVEGDYSYALGADLEVDGAHSFGIRLGQGGTTPVITDDNTMAIIGGNVGIGTVSPECELHVSGGDLGATIRLTADDNNNAEGANAVMIFSQDGGLGGLTDGIVGLEGIADQTFTNSLADAMLLVGRDGPLQLASYGTVGLTMTNNQQVGIGTTSPNGELHVSGGDGNARIRLDADADNVNETDNALMTFSQDGGAINGYVGLEGTDGQIASGSVGNSMMLVGNDAPCNWPATAPWA